MDLNLPSTSLGTNGEEKPYRGVFLSPDSDSEEMRLIITGRINLVILGNKPLVFHLQEVFYEGAPPSDDTKNDVRNRQWVYSSSESEPIAKVQIVLTFVAYLTEVLLLHLSQSTDCTPAQSQSQL